MRNTIETSGKKRFARQARVQILNSFSIGLFFFSSITVWFNSYFFKLCYYPRNKKAVFISPKNRANKFRQLVPERRRYSSPAPRRFSPANISHCPGRRLYTRPFFFSSQFSASDPSSDTFKPNRWQIIEPFRQRKKYARGFVVFFFLFFFFSFFYSRFSIRVFGIFVHSHRPRASFAYECWYPAYQVAPAIRTASMTNRDLDKNFRSITSRVYPFSLLWDHLRFFR